MKPEIKSAKVVSNKVLKSVWKLISDMPLPDIYAYTLTDRAFISTMTSLQETTGVIDNRVEEYGVNFDNKLIEALSFEFKGHMIILVKESVPLVSALEHELRHVVKWKHADEHGDP